LPLNLAKEYDDYTKMLSGAKISGFTKSSLRNKIILQDHERTFDNEDEEILTEPFYLPVTQDDSNTAHGLSQAVGVKNDQLNHEIANDDEIEDDIEEVE